MASAVGYRSINSGAAEEIARLNGIPQGISGANVLAHALTSAWLTYVYGAEAAREVGIGKELETYLSDQQRGLQWDSYKDLWNNNIGRQIGEYDRANGLTADQITDLVLDAYFIVGTRTPECTQIEHCIRSIIR